MASAVLTLSQPEPLVSGDTITGTFTFNEDVTGFVSNGYFVLNSFNFFTVPVTDIVEVSARVYTFTFVVPFSGDGHPNTVRVFLNTNNVDQGNSGIDQSYDYVATDSIRASAVFSPNPSINGEISTATITFTEDVTGIGLNDFSVSIGTINALRVISARVYEVEVISPQGINGNLILSLRENAANEGNTAASFSLNFQFVAPVATVTISESSIFYDETATVTVTFNTPVSGFEQHELTTDIGTLSNYFGFGLTRTTFTATLTPPQTGQGTITVTVAENAVSLGNDEATATIEYAPPPDLPTFEVLFEPENPINGEMVLATITASEAVTGLNGNDFSTNVGTIGTFSSISTTVYTIEVNPPSNSTGTLILTLREDAVTLTGNDEAQFELEYEQIIPVATITISESSLENRQTATVTVVFNIAVDGFNQNELTVNVGSLSNYSGFGVLGSMFQATLTAPATGEGTITVTVEADAVLLGNAEATAQIEYVEAPSDITIGETQPQNVIIDVPYIYNIPITGSVRSVEVFGLLTRFSNQYVSNNLSIFGLATGELPYPDAIWKIVVTDTFGDVTTREVVYNFIHQRPTIDAPDSITLIKGVDYTISPIRIPTENFIDTYDNNGHVIGLGSVIEEETNDILLTGIIDSELVIGVDEFDLELTVVNSGGFDIVEVPVEIVEVGNIGIVDSSGDELYIINVDATEQDALSDIVKTIDLPPGLFSPVGVTRLYDNVVAVIDDSGDELVVIDVDATADGDEAVAIKEIDLPPIISAPRGVTHLYGGNVVATIDDTGNELVVFNIDDTLDGEEAVTIKRVVLPSNLSVPDAITHISGGSTVAVIDDSGDELFVFDIDATDDDATAVPIKRILLPLNLIAPTGMTLISGGIVVVLDSSGRELFVFDIDATPEDERAVALKRITYPSIIGLSAGCTTII